MIEEKVRERKRERKYPDLQVESAEEADREVNCTSGHCIKTSVAYFSGMPRKKLYIFDLVKKKLYIFDLIKKIK